MALIKMEVVILKTLLEFTLLSIPGHLNAIHDRSLFSRILSPVYIVIISISCKFQESVAIEACAHAS